MTAIPDTYNHTQVEKKWLVRWLERGLYKWDPARGRDQTFVVDTPPPTVSGSLHVGSAFGYIQQDIIVRQRRMQGLNIFYPMGWDDNGLPTERRVQNLFNVRCSPTVPYRTGFAPRANKKEPPEEISRDNFIELCHQATKSDEQAFKALWQHLGLSIDWSLEYATIDDHSRRTSQLSFLKLYRDGHVYASSAPHLWDVDFKTAVSQAEVEDRMIPGHFCNITFGVEGGSTSSPLQNSIVIATTRPELLPACVAVIAHPDDDRYKPFFGRQAVTPLFRAPVPIIADPAADPAKGTGILMVCTFGDMMDVEWWRKYGLPLRQVVGKDGRMAPATFGSPGWASRDKAVANKHYADLVGKTVKQAQLKVIELLRHREVEALPGLGAPLAGEPQPLEHPVKMYERGERPLEILPTMQWFIRIMDKKEAFLEQGQKITWHPAHMAHRYQDWVNGLNQDWCVSRQRYFGVPIPMWFPLDAAGKALYDKPILPPDETLPVDPLSKPAPGYDESQRGQPGGFMGDPDVMDTWATSSMTPQIASRWAEDPARHQQLFPMDIRPQGPEIIRTWAFYTIVKAYLHQDTVPWHHVLVNGWIIDPDRKKMSKSVGNVVTPEPLVEKFSSDGFRYWAAKARLGVDTAYDEGMFQNGKRLVIKLYNATKFAAGHLTDYNLMDLNPDKITEPLDLSFTGHLKLLVEQTGRDFEGFDYADALQEVEGFFWESFCDNYLELVKARTYQQGEGPGKLSALATLWLALSVQLRLFAPFIPYFTEEAWSWLFATPEGRGRSVHTSAWPGVQDFAGLGECGLADPFGAAVEVLAAVRKAKSEAKVSVKTPVAHLVVSGGDEDLKVLKAVEADLLPTCGAEGWERQEGKPESGRYQVSITINS